MMVIEHLVNFVVRRNIMIIKTEFLTTIKIKTKTIDQK